LHGDSFGEERRYAKIKRPVRSLAQSFAFLNGYLAIRTAAQARAPKAEARHPHRQQSLAIDDQLLTVFFDSSHCRQNGLECSRCCVCRSSHSTLHIVTHLNPHAGHGIGFGTVTQ